MVTLCIPEIAESMAAVSDQAPGKSPGNAAFFAAMPGASDTRCREGL